MQKLYSCAIAQSTSDSSVIPCMFDDPCSYSAQAKASRDLDFTS